MSTPSMKEAVLIIRDAFSRRKGTFALARHVGAERIQSSAPFSLSAGAIKAVKTGGGFIVTLALDREKVERLRAMCDEALREEDADVQ